MRKALFAAALALLAAAPARAQEGEGSNPTIYLTTRETTRLVPDQATVYVVIDRQGTAPAEAAQRAQEAERSVAAALDGLRPRPHAVELVRYGVAPARSSNRAEPATDLFMGRTVVRVDVRDLGQLAAISSAALGSGATLIGEPQFSSSRSEAVRQQLVARAMERARTEARAIAAASGGTLGRLRHANFGQAYAYDPTTQATLPSDSPYHNANRPAPEIAVRVEVSSTWELVGMTP